jgi:hypothetical protein
MEIESENTKSEIASELKIPLIENCEIEEVNDKKNQIVDKENIT